MKLLDFERQFNVANKTAASITEQNGRVVRAQTEVEDPEFLDIALDGISEEQTETVETLTDFVNALPYEELANEYDRRQTELAQIKNDLESGAELETDQASRLAIKSLAALVSEISPRREKQVEELAEKRIKQLDDESKTALWEELKAKKLEFEDIQLLFEENSGPWDVPLLSNHGRRDADGNLVIEDEIPVDPGLKTVEDPIPSDFIERHIDAPEATQRLAYYFKQNPGQITGVSRLVEYLYNKDAIESNPVVKLRSRVTTLLGPGINGVVVKNILEQEDVCLQWGWRRLVERKDGHKKILCTRRIYRSYPYGQKPQDLREDVADDQEIIWEEEGYSKSKSEIARAGVAGIVRQVVEAPKLVAEYDGDRDEIVVESADPRTEQSAERKTTEPEKWAEFRSCVHQSVSRLVEREVIISREELVKLSLVKVRSGSRTMGTQTSIDRMAATRLIRRHMSVDDPLTPDLIVAMDLFNSQRDKFNRLQQDQAMVIIQEELDKVLGVRG
jgi:hypothetical protein